MKHHNTARSISVRLFGHLKMGVAGFCVATGVASAADLSAISDFGAGEPGFSPVRVTQGRQSATVEQRGNNNVVQARQLGLNALQANQAGIANVAITQQSGSQNWQTLAQSGNGNQYIGSQSGYGNSSSASQQGNNNYASVSQGGSSNSASVTQRGNNNQATIIQSGSNTSLQIQQAGNGARALAITR